MLCGMICIVTLATDKVFYQPCCSHEVVGECWPGAVSSRSTPHSVHSCKPSCGEVHRLPESHTETAGTSDLGDRRAPCLRFLSDLRAGVTLSSVALHPPFIRERDGREANFHT